MEADEEAFLSTSPGSDSPECVRKDTPGAEFAPRVREAVDTSLDIVLTKTHYSAFASAQQQLLQLLRRRFVTEMYVCGALTNVSIYATALDAGRHGYDMTIVEDCCGFRNEMRHVNAVRRLMQLTGSEVVNADELIAKLQPAKPKPKSSPRTAKGGDKTEGGGAGGSGAGQKSPVRPSSTAAPKNQSSGLSPSISKLSLSRSEVASPAAVPASPSADSRPTSAAQPQQQGQSKDKAAAQPIQPMVVAADTKSDIRQAAGTTQRACALRVDDSAPLEADPAFDELSYQLESLEVDSPPRDRDEASVADRRIIAPVTPTKQSVLEKYKCPLPAGHTSAESSASAAADAPPANQPDTTRVRAKQRRRVRQSGTKQAQSVKSSPTAKSDAIEVDEKHMKGTNKSDELAGPSLLPQASDSGKGTSSTPEVAPSAKMLDQASATTPTVSEPLCEGDTTVVSNVLPPTLAADAFERLLNEASWAGMSHLGGEVPRRIAVQGAIDEEGNMPVYRHPADESPPLLPFSPTVLEIKTEIEKHLGHPLNHVLIQHYRSGNDYISEHSDKTLDIVRGSFIANVSLGAERTMIFRTKRPPKDAKDAAAAKKEQKPGVGSDDESVSGPEKARRQVQRAQLPHNSLCRMGLATNERWLHAIRQDKRSDREKTAAELAFGGARISLTFRHIGTFLDSSQTHIWGQGATCKTKEGAKPVINGQTPEAVQMLKAFGTENHSSDFDWEAQYGSGFDVLHMGTPKRLFSGSDPVANMRVSLALVELGISCAKGAVEGAVDVRFEDNDPARAVVDGHETILRYLDAVYGPGRRYDQMPFADVAKRFTRLQQALDLLPKWRAMLKDGESVSVKAVKKQLLAEWERYAEDAALKTTAEAGGDGEKTEKNAGSGTPVYISGGDHPAPADYALWPVLHTMVQLCGEGVFEEDGQLGRYYRAFKQRSAVAKVLGK
ncbi:alpha-ketoglutarate-dependent dioxygenase alkB 2 [Diplogelasinospora grovesii]|uniref:Alpha-ketoglutarate-dependent dioxygenase alkB 2 n=1 Tax=Diplogelasinospora grovesii TaxID=303347 RepID=A0AAN6NBV7_9PEZI|nr:alpha-ketoglutarate-dependent dioxygenase alkB 2 [Diplogelasinospora grovesii]